MRANKICECCAKEFSWNREPKRQNRKYCSKECTYKILRERNKNQFRWDKLTKEKMFVQLKKNFDDRIEKREGCWRWKGAKDKNGYGQMQVDSKNRLIKAHRISWMLFRGEIPKKINVCHTCDNAECTNPEHLFLGTPKENTHDMIKKGRNAKGSKMSTAKLKEKDIPQIRKLIDMGVTMSRIARDYLVKDSTIRNIKYGLTWKHV